MKLSVKLVPKFIRFVAFEAIAEAMHRIEATDVESFRSKCLSAVWKALKL